MKKVYEFNQGRNSFQLNVDNEKKMLQEEIREFYDAATLAEQVDAVIDVRYVYEGTQMKFNANLLPMDEDIQRTIGEFHRISTTIIADALGDKAEFLQKIMEKAYEIVCSANEMKGSKLDADGKVIKDDRIPNATIQIQEMLDSALN